MASSLWKSIGARGRPQPGPCSVPDEEKYDGWQIVAYKDGHHVRR
jgi:hypothetical protein